MFVTAEFEVRLLCTYHYNDGLAGRPVKSVLEAAPGDPWFDDLEGMARALHAHLRGLAERDRVRLLRAGCSAQLESGPGGDILMLRDRFENPEAAAGTLDAVPAVLEIAADIPCEGAAAGAAEAAYRAAVKERYEPTLSEVMRHIRRLAGLSR